MRQIRAATFLSIFLLVGLANAANQAQKEEAANAKGKGRGTSAEASADGSNSNLHSK